MNEKGTEIKNKDDKNQTDDDPEAIYRIYSVISYFIVLVIIGLPVWWFTTRVYRASLPIDRMYNVDLPNKTHKSHSIPLSLDYDILISVVNPDPTLKVDLNTIDLDWNLQPFLKTVEPIADFTIKSQWLYLVELGEIPYKTKDHYALHQEQLPHVITPLEKKLWSHLSPRPCINLVLYISPCKFPLYIYDSNNTMLETNAFISPGWGGIFIVNTNSTACTNKVFTPKLQPIVSTFLTQLKQLLGMTGVSSQNDLIELQRSKALEMIDSARRTLKSLAQLLSEISSIVISDEVALKIEVAVEHADEAECFLETGDVENGLKKAKIAYANAEAAFSDPSLLALLYFPDDQKYAVYIPLFLPVMIPVLMSLMTVRKYFCNKNKLKVE